MANTSTPEIIVHTSSYAGNNRSGAHLDACLKRNVSTSDMCEIDMRLHVSFTPGHPAIQAFTRAHNVLCAAIEMERHIREDHADGSSCPVTPYVEGRDLAQIEVECSKRGIRCTKGE